MTRPNFFRRALLGALCASGLVAASGPAFAQSDLGRPDVIIGWTPWSDAEVVTKLAAQVLRDHMGKDVELTLADISAQFRTIAKGDVDLMLMSWEPNLHASYLRRHGDDLVDLGTIYEGTIGLAVPDWVPEDRISSIEDLQRPEIQEALDGRIVGIDPGAGLMQTTRTAMTDYGLDAYTLEEGTGPSMQREIAKAERSESLVVVTAWRPHMKFGLYGMRYLEDPKGLYADVSEIHARASKDFVDRQPEIAEMIRAMSFTSADIEAIMVEGREIGIDNAITKWIDANADTVARWVK